MSNTSCPFPFVDAALFPRFEGYVDGRLCATLPLPGQKPGAQCCLPCPVQNYALHPSILEALHWNDIVNVIGVGVGAFVLLSFIFLPEKVTYRSSLGISISLAAFLINFCFVFPLHDLRSLQCANEITPANLSSNPICGFQGSLHVFAGHAVALLVVCRTIYLHCQICWNLHVSRIPLIVLNIIGWAIPAIFLCIAYGVAQITYTIGNHCSIRVDWVVNLLIIPIIIEVGCSIVVQFATFVYCVNVYMRSLREPTPPTNDSIPDSTYSGGSSRYPYRKAMARVNKAFRLQWRAWAQCFSLIWTGTLFSTAYFILATKYVDMQKELLPGTTPDQDILLWVVCILQAHGDAAACDKKATFIPNQTLMVIAEFSLSTCWVWVSLIFLRISFFTEWVRLIRRTCSRIFRRNRYRSSSSTDRSDYRIHLHTPSKEFNELKTKPLERHPYQLGSLHLPQMAIDLHSPLKSHHDDHTAILQQPQRPGSSRPGSRPGSSRPGSSRSNTLIKKKKISVEEILAMRRMEQEGASGEYPGIQPMRITSLNSDRNNSDNEEPWPVYRFGQEDRQWNRI